LETTKVSHTEYADDIALVANTAQHLQFQLVRFYDYTVVKELTLNTDKTKVMAFFSSSNPIFFYHAMVVLFTPPSDHHRSGSFFGRHCRMDKY